MIQASVYGRLGRDPRPTTSQAGKPMCTAQMAVDVGKDSGTETLWISIMAFGRCAEGLERHQKGDMIGVIGRLQRGRYTGNDGHEREVWSLLADALHSSRTVRPGSSRRRDPGPPNPEPGAPDSTGEPPSTHYFEEGLPFDDRLPF